MMHMQNRQFCPCLVGGEQSSLPSRFMIASIYAKWLRPEEKAKCMDNILRRLFYQLSFPTWRTLICYELLKPEVISRINFFTDYVILGRNSFLPLLWLYLFEVATLTINLA